MSQSYAHLISYYMFQVHVNCAGVAWYLCVQVLISPGGGEKCYVLTDICTCFPRGELW